MFGPITIPYESVMLYNVATLKYGVEFEWFVSMTFLM